MASSKELANPDVTLQDAWPDYETYQASTDREIPVVVFEARD